MSGHSKWSTIKRKKGVADAKKAAVFTKFAQAITLAVKQGGSDPKMNFSLRLAIDKAQGVNMPKNNIERAIERASGTGMEEMFEVVYEGFAPSQTAVIIRCITDNKNRTVAQLKHVFSKHGGTFGSPGSVMWMFEHRGVIELPFADNSVTQDEIELIAVEAGALDMKVEDDGVVVFTQHTQLQQVCNALKEKGLKLGEQSLQYVAKERKILLHESKEAQSVIAFLETLEDEDDVNDVFTNVVFER